MSAEATPAINDVANAVGPLAAIYQATNQILNQPYQLETPLWILFLGAAGIVIGLATLGYRVMKTIGENIVKLTPTKGFSAQLAAALTVVIASQLDMPVSTTHCQVGSIVGCGLVGGRKNIQWKLLKGIFFSWFITLPFTGLLSSAIFSYGIYSP